MSQPDRSPERRLPIDHAEERDQAGEQRDETAGQRDEKAEAFSAGADEYIVKPFAPRDLVSRVRTALRRRQADNPT